MTIQHQLNEIKSEYPNALAYLKVSLSDMTVQNIYNFTEIKGLDEIMANNTNDCTNDSTKNELELIWKNLNNGKIDITYACIGYSLDGRPVLNQHEFISLLIEYGFSMQGIYAFFADYVEVTKKLANSNYPIFMSSVNNARIMTEIKPIVNKKRKKK